MLIPHLIWLLPLIYLWVFPDFLSFANLSQKNRTQENNSVVQQETNDSEKYRFLPLNPKKKNTKWKFFWIKHAD